MKKIITSLLLCAALQSFTYAQETKPRIYLEAPVVNLDDSQLNAIANTIFDTTQQFLVMLNKYEVETNRAIRVIDHSAYCASENIDNLISGKCEVLDNGSYEISLFTYDREKNEITNEKTRTAESVLEVFDIVDSIVLELLSDFSGHHIAFGNLQVVNTGNQGTYSFTLDGTPYAGNEEILENLLIGDHALKVEQVRMEGPCTVAEKTIVIEEDETLIEEISIPEILDSEKETLAAEELFISENRDKSRKKKDVDAAFKRMLTLLDDTSYSAAMGEYKQNVEQDYQDWLGTDFTEEDVPTESSAVAEEKKPRKKRNLDRFFNVYIPVEFLGGNYASTGLGCTLFHRKLDMKFLAGWTSYELEDINEKLGGFSMGLELEHHPMKNPFGLYYGGFFRWNQFEWKDFDDYEYYMSEQRSTYWAGLTAGVEYTIMKGFTFYGNTRMFNTDMTDEFLNWSFSLGGKLWF